MPQDYFWTTSGAGDFSNPDVYTIGSPTGPVATSAPSFLDGDTVTIAGGPTVADAIDVYNGGDASAADLYLSGYDVLYADVTAENVQVQSGVLQIEADGGLSPDRVNNGRLEIGSGGTATAQLLLDGGAIGLESITIDAGSSLVGFGNAAGNPQGITQITDNGLIEASGGTLDLGSVSGTGTLQIDEGATAALGYPSAVPITFAGPSAVLLDSTGFPSAPISGFSASDEIQIQVLFGSYTLTDQDTTATETTLSVMDDGTNESLVFMGDYIGQTFTLTNFSDGADLIVAPSVACYCRGTSIATPDGEIAVEALAIGDLVLTQAGMARPVRWIGRRSYDGRFAFGNRDILPVRIKAGALANGVPHRDLQVSPLHAMALDGMLIPAVCLVNGISIVQANQIDRVDYVHVELETHDVILAEGAAAESFVDDDSRAMFHNAHEFHALYPDMPRQSALYCHPRVEEGAELEAVRCRLKTRAVGAMISQGQLAS